MTVASSTNRVDYTGNGSTTVFSFTFRIFAATDLVVTKADADGVETVLTLNTDYTVTGVGSYSGGTVTISPALSSDYDLTIQRVLPLTQETDLRNQGQFFAETHEDVFDRMSMINQQLQEQLDRAAKLPVTNTADADALVADIVLLADNLSDLNTIADAISDIQTVADDLNEATSEIEVVAGAITNVNTVGSNISNVNTVAGVSSNVTTVAGVAANVTTVAGISSAVSGVAAISSAVSAVNSNATNINAVNSNASNINTVAGIASDVDTVAGIASDVAAVENIASNVTTVAGISSAVSTVAGISSAVSTVSSNNTNVSTVATNIASVQSAATNMAAIIAAPTEASNAASSASAASASAAAAAASAASGMYSAVHDKSANYTVVAGDAGDLIRVTTTGGAVTITLPAISSVSDGFKVAIVKWTGDSNQVTIARSSSDTINGATSATIGSQYTSTTFVADFETSQWLSVTSGLGATNVAVDSFNGNGSTVAFTLSGDPGTENNTQVFVGGVYQEKDTYSVSGTTLTFSTAPPSGTSNIEVTWTQPLAVGVPSDGTVSTAKIADGAVTNAKMASGAAKTNLGLSSWSFYESGGVLYFQYSGTSKFKIDSSGNLTVTGNVTAYGTM